MRWTHERTEAYVRSLEGFAARDPAGYRLRVVLLSLFGTGTVLLFALAALGLLVAMVSFMLSSGHVNGLEIKFGLVLLVFAFGMLRSLHVAFPPAEGLPLTRDDSPALFEAVDRLTTRLGAPRFHRVLLDGNYNASVYQRPRLGVFGWPENILTVGMGMMLALSPEQFEMVLAHEFGHLRSGHGRLGAWIFRVNATWQRIAETETGGFLMRAFAGWYFPYLSAYTFALRRQDEFEADRAGVELAGARAYADECCLERIRGKICQGYWESVMDSVTRLPEPPSRVFEDLEALFRDDATPLEEREALLRRALAEAADYHESHPGLAEALKAIGEAPRVPPNPSRNAAEHLFGDALPRWIAALSASWRANLAEGWAKAYAQAQEAHGELSGFEARLERGEALTDDERYGRAFLTERLRGEAAAEPLYRELLDASPQASGAAALALGRILAERGDPETEGLLTVARERNPALASPALATLRAYHQRRGDAAAAQHLTAELLRQADIDDAAGEEAQRLDRSMRLAPHGLDPAVVASVLAALAPIADIGRIYLARKELSLSSQPQYLIGFTLARRFWRLNPDQDIAKIVAALPDTLPEVDGPVQMVAAVGQMGWLEKALKQVPGSLIRADGARPI